MVDPLSITTSVVALLTTCIKADGGAIADTKIKGLLTDVGSFSQVLQVMKETLEQEMVQSSFQATGHIDNHWSNLSTSIRDGQTTLV
jgi:hypothetical protein